MPFFLLYELTRPEQLLREIMQCSLYSKANSIIFATL